MSIDLSMVISGKKAMPPRIVVYGVEGIGKSSFAAEAPETIFINTEDGIAEVDAHKFPPVQSFDEVMETINFLINNDHPYKTLAVDTIDWLEPLIWQEVIKDLRSRETKYANIVNIEDVGFAKGYVFALDYWRLFFDALNELRRVKKMPVILVAHEHIKRFDSPEVDPFDRYELKLNPKAAALAYEWADAILFINYLVSIARTDVGFKKEVKRGIGGGERFIYTEERPAFKAKNRYGLPPAIPFIKNQGWNALIEAMSANFNQKGS